MDRTPEQNRIQDRAGMRAEDGPVIQGYPGFPSSLIRDALDNAAILAITDVQGTITFVNGKFSEISGYSAEELIGANHRKLRSEMHDTGFFREMYRCIANGRTWHGEICNRRKDGSLYWVDTTIVPFYGQEGKIAGYTAIRFDITPRKEVEAALRTSKSRLKEAAHIDQLTGLHNRRWFQERVSRMIGRSATRQFYLGMFDIDFFKEINDSFGHQEGDRLLRDIAGRLMNLSDRRFMVARLGGDEFGFLLREDDDEAAQAFFQRVLDVVREPVMVAGTLRNCSCSMGVAVFPNHGRDGDDLLKAADLALYQAKETGRDRLEMFTQQRLDEAMRHMEFLQEVEGALGREEFRLHYQPIVPAAHGSQVSFEALMRWYHPVHGILSPGSFLTGLREPAIFAALGLYMLRCLFRDASQLVEQGVPFRRIAFNITNADLRSDEFIELFFRLSAETGISPDRFCTEVTEGMFLGRDDKQVRRCLQRLHDAGVEIALDDFGTGFASLTHLRELPIDRLKIDRGFTINLTSATPDKAIIRGIIDIAHSIGKVVTAEGVETPEQVSILRNMGCDSFQGWYFCKATPVADLADAVAGLPGFPVMNIHACG